MTAGNYGYGSMRATDADREKVRTALQDAHAQGRLSWEEFDSRSTAVVSAQTYDQLAGLTADLQNRTSTTPQALQDTQGIAYQGNAFPGVGYQDAAYQGNAFPGSANPGNGYQGNAFQGNGYQGNANPGGFGGGYAGGGSFGPVTATNSMAIAALICGVLQLFFWFFTGIPAIILGHIARRQIRATGEQGAGMALAGMILGYVGLVFAVLFAIAFVLIVAFAAHSTNGFQPPPSP